MEVEKSRFRIELERVQTEGKKLNLKRIFFSVLLHLLLDLNLRKSDRCENAETNVADMMRTLFKGAQLILFSFGWWGEGAQGSIDVHAINTRGLGGRTSSGSSTTVDYTILSIWRPKNIAFTSPLTSNQTVQNPSHTWRTQKKEFWKGWMVIKCRARNSFCLFWGETIIFLPRHPPPQKITYNTAIKVNSLQWKNFLQRQYLANPVRHLEGGAVRKLMGCVELSVSRIHCNKCNFTFPLNYP